MKKIVLVAASALFALGLCLGSAQAKDAPKAPEKVTNYGKKDVVTFDHAKHKEAGADKCTACHTKVFKMKKGQSGTLTMDKMKAGEFCGACHDGKTQVGSKTPASVADKEKCTTCHKK